MRAALPRPGRRRARTALRDLAYSPLARALARSLEDSPGLRGALERRGHGELLHRLASEVLPRGHYYARLTIRDWTKHRGADFRLLERGEVVYGNRIQPPPEGTPLEYRNLLVTSDDPADFTLDIPARYTLHVGLGAFSTPEQDAYDAKYGVRRRDGLFCSIRGNTTNPSRLLITFPGFPPANSRVSYAVSYLKALTGEDLAETLMVCFQDRYGVSGTYMVHDNAGRPLAGRLTGAVRGLMERHGIAEEDVLLFGASKGASTAVSAARDLPGARQVLVAPQMSLPYYLAKPVLRGGLFRDRALWEVEQPGSLLRRYLDEGRRIDYFYSDADESSNCSLIEYLRDVEGLTKHRIGGAHAAVAKRSLPTVLSLLRGFAAGAADGQGAALECTGLTSTPRDLTVAHRVQFADASVPEAGNVHLEGWLGRTRFRQLLSAGEDRAARYTPAAQRTDPALHPAEFTQVVAFDGTPQARIAQIPATDVDVDADADADIDVGAGRTRHPQLAPDALTCHASEPREYALLAAAGAPSARMLYVSALVDPCGQRAELHLVPTLEGLDPAERPALLAPSAIMPEPADAPEALPVARFLMSPLAPWSDLRLLVRRIAVVAEVEQVRVSVADPSVAPDQIRELEASGWPAVTVHDARPT